MWLKNKDLIKSSSLFSLNFKRKGRTFPFQTLIRILHIITYKIKDAPTINVGHEHGIRYILCALERANLAKILSINVSLQMRCRRGSMRTT